MPQGATKFMSIVDPLTVASAQFEKQANFQGYGTFVSDVAGGDSIRTAGSRVVGMEEAYDEYKNGPEIFTPDPVAEESALAAAQAEERSLINKAGLQTTKKVRSLLGKESKFGSTQE